MGIEPLALQFPLQFGHDVVVGRRHVGAGRGGLLRAAVSRAAVRSSDATTTSRRYDDGPLRRAGFLDRFFFEVHIEGSTQVL